jgi:hypothetical protein
MSLSRKIFLTFAVGALAASPAAGQGTAELFTWSGRLATGATFSVRHFNGPIDVRESTTDRVEFRAERRTRRGDEVSFDVQQRSDGVEICSVYRERNICDNSRRGWGWDNGPPSTRLTILLPKGVRLAANTGNGDVTVERASNDVQIRSGNGDVRIRMTAGEVDVTTGNGELDIDGATGPVRASTGNGRVSVVTSSGPVNARSGNGEIDVRMRTMQNAGDMTFSTGNGAVTVALPGNFNGEIDASTGHGEFRSDFEIRIVGRLNPRHVRGTIGSGGPRIRMSSGNGRLELRRIN